MPEWFGTHRLSSGGSHTCAVFPGGALKCWGANNSGQLGLGDSNYRGRTPEQMGDDLPFVDVGLPRKVSAVEAGRDHTCVLLADGGVKCFGENYAGQLGTGDHTDRGIARSEMGESLPRVRLGTGRTAVAVTAGDGHSCALLDGGTVKCWGTPDGDPSHAIDSPDELGDALLDVPLPGKAVRVEAGFAMTCALVESGDVACWGRNIAGNLGTGDTRSHSGLPSDGVVPTVDLGTGRRAIDLDVGANVACALLDDRSIKCWGSGAAGLLGQGDTLDRGDAAGELGDALPPIDVGPHSTITAIRTGWSSVCAVLDGRVVRCWGQNDEGQLGVGDKIGRGDQPGEMGAALVAADLGPTGDLVDLSVGQAHACATVADGRIRCWGRNSSYQLGHGSDHVGDEPGEMGAALRDVDVGTVDGMPEGPGLSACALTRNGCASVCGATGETCSTSCPELGGSHGFVFGSAEACEALSTPVETIDECAQQRSAVADYVRCCCR